MRCWILPLLCLALSACATSSQQITQQGFEAIATLRTLPAESRPRVVVARIVDQTDGSSTQAFRAGLSELDATQPVDSWLGGVRDVLQTALVNSGAFTVLERTDLEELEEERWWTAERGEVALAQARLEGADILVAPALTSFEPSGGGALPLPIPLSSDGDFAIIWLRTGSSSLSMDLRLIDVATGRVLNAVAVRGKARNYRADLDLFLFFDRGVATLPGVLGIYNNTPLHAAVLKMVNLAVASISAAATPGPVTITDPKTAALFAADTVPAADSAD